MAVDRYTKLVLTVIAVCLIWLSLNVPSLMTPVSAQQGVQGNRVILAGWVDNKGNVLTLPTPHTSVLLDRFGQPLDQPAPPSNAALPMTDIFK